MPVKKRTAKRRIDPTAELAAWECMFDAGFDFFDDLPSFGVETDYLGRPDADVTREAWSRLGLDYLANRRPDDRKPWALTEMGVPHAG